MATLLNSDPDKRREDIEYYRKVYLRSPAEAREMVGDCKCESPPAHKARCEELAAEGREALRQRDEYKTACDLANGDFQRVAEKYDQLKADLARMREKLSQIDDILNLLIGHDEENQERLIGDIKNIIATEVPILEKPEPTASDVLDKFWKDIIARKPKYGDWKYAGQAYRHIKAEFEVLKSEMARSKAEEPTPADLGGATATAARLRNEIVREQLKAKLAASGEEEDNEKDPIRAMIGKVELIYGFYNKYDHDIQLRFADDMDSDDGYVISLHPEISCGDFGVRPVLYIRSHKHVDAKFFNKEKRIREMEECPCEKETKAEAPADLEPCPNPKCTGKSTPVIDNSLLVGPPDTPIFLYFVKCMDCRVCGPEEETLEAARAAWNGLPRRTTDGVIEILEEEENNKNRNLAKRVRAGEFVERRDNRIVLDLTMSEHIGVKNALELSKGVRQLIKRRRIQVGVDKPCHCDDELPRHTFVRWNIPVTIADLFPKEETK